ncbi:unnamed protein product [Calypogeia fissa]
MEKSTFDRVSAVMGEVLPIWLPGFVEPEYFTECHEHIHHNAKSRAGDQGSTKKGDRNYYCVDCCKGPLCETGRQVEHGGHTVLQVRKASHTDAIRVNDIAKLVDIEHIQTYTINGAKIVFLPSRPQAKPAKGSPRYCEMCNRSLQDLVRFCSLSCKMKAIINRPGDASLTFASNGAAMHLSGPEDLQAISGNWTGNNDVLRPASPSPAVPAKKRARSSKEFAPSALVLPQHQPSDKLHREGAHSPTSVLLGHDQRMHMTVESSSAVSAGAAESSSSQESLESVIMSFRKKSRKSAPIRAPGVGIYGPEWIHA